MYIYKGINVFLKSFCIFIENGLKILQQNVPGSESLEMSAVSCMCDSSGVYLWPPTQKKPGDCVCYPHTKIWYAVLVSVSASESASLPAFLWKL